MFSCLRKIVVNDAENYLKYIKIITGKVLILQPQIDWEKVNWEILELPTGLCEKFQN